MDIKQLSYFVAVAQYASFSKASEAIHVSQPTLSKMIRNLEEELGLLLFTRTTRKVELTEAGKAVIAHAQTVLHAAHNLLAATADLKQMRTGKFSLGLPPVIGASFFPKIIAEYHHLHPEVTIQLIEEGGKRIEQLLLEGAIDLGVVVLPIEERLFDSVPIVKRELKLVIPKDHPFVGRAKVALHELRDEAFILFRHEFNLHDRVKAACIQEGFEPIVAYESSQWDFIYELISASQGIAMLPETICAKFDHSRVHIIQQIEPSIHWDLAIIWKKDGYLSHAAKGWIDHVHQIKEW